jgi:hypothetical protein
MEVHMRDVFVLVSFAVDDHITAEQAQEFARQAIDNRLDEHAVSVQHGEGEQTSYDTNGGSEGPVFEREQLKLMANILKDTATATEVALARLSAPSSNEISNKLRSLVQDLNRILY